MIKGKLMGEMLIIKDTTEGIRYLFIMIIMCLFIYSLFQFVYAYVASHKVERLKHCEYLLNKHKKESTHKKTNLVKREEKRELKEAIFTEKPKREKRSETEYTQDEIEELDILHELRG